MTFPFDYREEMRALLGEGDYLKYESCMAEAPSYGLRLNPEKVPEDRKKQVLDAAGAEDAVPWSAGLGYYYGGEASPSKSPYYFAGLYYLQEPSAMAPGALLPVETGDRVLDLCAAPGGKSTGLGAGLAGSGFLLSNDVSASRAKALLKNLELFGIGNCVVSGEEPERLLSAYGMFFDKILVDAPCSGEGMFRREPSMAESWLERGPEYYVPIQRRLLSCAVSMLKQGGLLLYSTCTFARAEDEDNIRWLLAKFPEMELVPIAPEHGFVQGLDGCSVRLFPWKLRGEGHFAALLRKKGGAAAREEVSEAAVRGRRKANEEFLKKQEAFAEFRRLITAPLEERGYYWEREGSLYLLPIPPEELPKLRYLRTGLLLGTVKKNRFEPSQALSMYLKQEEFVNWADFSSGDIRTVKYLKGETVDTEGAGTAGSDGWCLVCTDGWPLGFAKRNRNTLKNKYYPGWRWQ